MLRSGSASNRVVLAVAVFYLLFSLVALGLHGGDPLWFAWLGERYADLDPAGRRGYDGQFVYYIATLGRASVPHLDAPAYRLQRVLLPVLVRGLSTLTTLSVAWVIPLVNFGAVVITSYLLATWLSERRVSPWYALTYALYVGVVMAYSRDLTEPLAFCFAAWGVTTWYRERFGLATLAFACAAMTKEITLLFPTGIVLAMLAERRFWRALWPAVAVAPLLLWETFLYTQFGQLPFRSGPSLEAVPLAGILPYLDTEPGRLSAFLFAGVPALVSIPIAIWLAYQNRKAQLPTVWVLLHGVFVLLLPLNVYNHIMHAGRNAAGLILSVVFLMPQLYVWLRTGALLGALAPTLVWLVPVLRWAPWLSET